MIGWFAIGIGFISFVILYEILLLVFSKRIKTSEHFQVTLHAKATKTEINSVKSLVKAISRRKPGKVSLAKTTRLQDQLDKSGLSRQYTPAEWSLLKQLVALVIALIMSVLGWLASIDLIRVVFLALLAYGVVLYVFRWVVLVKITSRRDQMQMSLPFSLDLITISVQAGLSFDGALLKVVETQNHALTWEFEKFLKEVRMGVQRRLALKNMMYRVDLDDFRTVIQAILQADELGSSLSQVLKVQSDLMRYKRKMKAKETALKAPVKMLFPLIFFIFPAIFVIILGPAVIQIMEVFK
jgi:tight adherence protein C